MNTAQAAGGGRRRINLWLVHGLPVHAADGRSRGSLAYTKTSGDHHDRSPSEPGCFFPFAIASAALTDSASYFHRDALMLWGVEQRAMPASRRSALRLLDDGPGFMSPSDRGVTSAATTYGGESNAFDAISIQPPAPGGPAARITFIPNQLGT